MKQDITPLTVNIPTWLHRKFKSNCSILGSTMGGEIIYLIEKFNNDPLIKKSLEKFMLNKDKK